jgi:hypothetical protein
MSQDNGADPDEEPEEDFVDALDDLETLPCNCSYVSWIISICLTSLMPPSCCRLGFADFGSS